MIQKCPNCGQWCETDKKNAFERFGKGWSDIVDGAAEVGSSIFGEKVGSFLGGAAGGILGYAGGLSEAALGDKFQFECTNCGHTWSTDYESEDQTDEYQTEQRTLSEVAELVIATAELKNSSKSEIHNHIKRLQSMLTIDVIDENQGFKSSIYDALAYSYYELLGNPEPAFDNIKKSLKLLPDDPTSCAIAGMLRGINDAPQENYCAMQFLLKYRDIDFSDATTHFTQSQFAERFEQLSSCYIEKFLDIPVVNRRYLVFDDGFNYLPDSFMVLPIDHTAGISFPTGHPRNHEVYVVHPYKPNTYIPYNDYQFSLFRDEYNEFIWIMECLGAKSISVHEMHDEEKNSSAKRDATTGGGVDYASGKVNAQGSYNRGNESEEYLKLSKDLAKVKEFDITPDVPPYLPHDIVWYNHRPEWHRSCESRRMGRLSKASFKLSTSSISATSNQEKKKIEAELTVLLTKANGNHEKEEQVSLKTNENHTWSVDVEFYPLSDYNSNSPKLQPLLQETRPQKAAKSQKNHIVIGLVCVIILLLALVIGLFLK